MIEAVVPAFTVGFTMYHNDIQRPGFYAGIWFECVSMTFM